MITFEELERTREIEVEIEEISHELINWMKEVDTENQIEYCRHTLIRNITIGKEYVEVVCIDGSYSYGQQYDFSIPFKCFTGQIEEFKEEFLLEIEQKKQARINMKKELEEKTERNKARKERELYESLKAKYEKVE